MDPRYLAEYGSTDAGYSSPFQSTEYSPLPDVSTTADRGGVGNYSPHGEVTMTPYPADNSFLPHHRMFNQGDGFAQMYHTHHQGHNFLPIEINEPPPHISSLPQTPASISYGYDNGYHQFEPYQRFPRNREEQSTGPYQQFPNASGEHQVGATIFPPYPGQLQPSTSGQLGMHDFNTMHPRQSNWDTNNLDRLPNDRHQNQNEAIRSAGVFSDSLDPIATGSQSKGRTRELSPTTRAHANGVRPRGAWKDCRKKKKRVSDVVNSIRGSRHSLI